MSLTLNVEFPALDRLCAWLEGRDKAGLVGEIESEIVAKLKEAAEGGVPRPEFKDIERPENAPVERFQRDGAGRPLGTGKPEPKPKPEPEPAPAPKSEPKPEPEKPAGATLADVQQACARLRDAGKMNDVKGLFPEFGIKKLSDLKSAEQLAAFAARLKKLEG